MYKSGLIKPRKFLAVKTMSLAVDQGQVLAVLGNPKKKIKKHYNNSNKNKKVTMVVVKLLPFP